MKRVLPLILVALATTPVLPTATAAEPAIESPLTVTALFWGGYNLPTSDEFSKVTLGLTTGGFAGGVEFLAGARYIRGGVATSFIPIYVYTSDTGQDTKALMPFEGVLNFYLLGFYAGGRGGYVVDIGSTTVTGQNYLKTNGTVLGGQFGYQYTIGSLAFDIGAVVTFVHTEAAATVRSAGAHADYTNITPRVALQYTF
ncbi:hypothetical protein [Turneriella parva]|uniref:Outer membrane protein beta-barrel domain-containing protein n=1 Tax=Turneriella parva (strain ATCC BAA-1111 / DSM 21527 / NCTC 11395 / H) TaxID=869212 RepID=I4B1B4_TURPD|nr:hypothetical protein [Turneriella parva]AFM11071.1 hypothetical protein Turpa_0415 [Turneriella parva DSM 21527]